jgi:hypothetical protein
MDITEVRIKLIDDPSERLLAFCSITLAGAFVVRDLKVIVGPSGPFLAMPSRKLTSHCPGCGFKNALRAMYCNQCGRKQPEMPVPRDGDGRPRLYADIASALVIDPVDEHLAPEVAAAGMTPVVVPSIMSTPEVAAHLARATLAAARR